MDIKKDHINFAVGPVQISEEISRIGADPVPYFRTPDFSALMKENEALLKEFMDAPEDARAVFLTGSGTASMDAVTQNVFTKDDRLLVVAGGSFGHRFCEICEVYGIPHTAIELRQGHALTPADLAPYAGQGYTGFLVNMHETSTGVLYDMDMISAFCRENGLVLVVDAISAFLADDVSMKRWGADVVFTGSQKALAVPPGISMMVLSSRAVERIYANRPACYYLDLKAALKNGERGQTPFTPAVGILIQINARLNQIKRDGFANVQAQIRARRILFWHISRPLTATPPALAALAGANRTPPSRSTSMAAGVLGILAPSASAMAPPRTMRRAVSASISFWVAQGRATSQGTDHRSRKSLRNSLPGTNWAYSRMRPRRRSLMSFTTSSRMPSGS